jgi:hypothetical protein
VLSSALNDRDEASCLVFVSEVGGTQERFPQASTVEPGGSEEAGSDVPGAFSAGSWQQEASQAYEVGGDMADVQVGEVGDSQHVERWVDIGCARVLVRGYPGMGRRTTRRWP